MSGNEPVHNEGQSRFEVALEGQGVGGNLARAVLDWARAEQLRVVPQCRFMASYIRGHSEYDDLVLEG